MTKKTNSEKTRFRILMLLKQDGPQEAGMLAKQLDVTDMAIRQHLYALEELGDIAHGLVARPKGRPAKIWQLTDQASVHFPNSHAIFSTGLISSKILNRTLTITLTLTLTGTLVLTENLNLKKKNKTKKQKP